MKHSDIRMSDNAADYFKTCARIRGVSRSTLLRRLIVAIANDKLVESILDDGSKRIRYKSEHSKERKENGPNS